MAGPDAEPGAGRLDALLAELKARAPALGPAKRSISLRGHRTSLSLEEPFWRALRRLAAAEGLSLAELVARVDEARGPLNLSAALRLVVLAAGEGSANDRSDRSRS